MLLAVPIHDYLREARRLRARLAHNPQLLQRRLQQLSGLQPPSPPPAAEPTPAHQFAQRVAASIEGPILRYSRRVALLKHAQQLGIHRFEANLIIATVLHRAGITPVPTLLRPSRHPWLAPAATFLALQITILYLAWRLLTA